MHGSARLLSLEAAELREARLAKHESRQGACFQALFKKGGDALGNPIIYTCSFSVVKPRSTSSTHSAALVSLAWKGILLVIEIVSYLQYLQHCRYTARFSSFLRLHFALAALARQALGHGNA